MKNYKIIVSSLLFFMGSQYYAAEQNLQTTEHNNNEMVFSLNKRSFEQSDDFDMTSEQSDDQSLQSAFSDDEAERVIFEDNFLQDRKKLNLLHNLTPEQPEELSIEGQEDLDYSMQVRARIVKAKRDYQHKFNDDLYLNAINKIVEKKNMSVDAFHELSAHKKTTLLLGLMKNSLKDDFNELPIEEQEALMQLKEKRAKENELHNELHKKRKLENIPLAFNRKYAEAIKLVIESRQIDRVSFDALEKGKKLDLLLTLTAEQRATLPLEEQKALDYSMQVRAREVKAKRDYQHKFNDDLYLNAINKIVEKKNMSINAFNELSAHKKTTLLLGLMTNSLKDDFNELPAQEQAALVKLKEKRTKDNEWGEYLRAKRKSKESNVLQK